MKLKKINLFLLKQDIFGGLTAAIVALPLGLAFGVSSGLGPLTGLYGAIFVGFFASLFGGTPKQISGPTGPMTVIVALIFIEFDFKTEAVFFCIILSGFIQIIFGILRFGRFSESVNNILHAIHDRRHELVFSFLITLSLMLLSATVLYVVEGETQPEAFGSIPRSLWVSSAALLSTGYGDYTPITFLGRVAAVFTALFGIGAVALPAGILAGAFTEKNIRKND